jgi:hypothetical protein
MTIHVYNVFLASQQHLRDAEGDAFIRADLAGNVARLDSEFSQLTNVPTPAFSSVTRKAT